MLFGTLRSLFRVLYCSLTVILAGSLSPCFGHELYNTDLSSPFEHTALFGTRFTAVPLGSFDFGSGPISVGDANMVLNSSKIPESRETRVEVIALSLTNGSLFVTMQSERGLNPLDPPPGPSSLGMRSEPSVYWDMVLEMHVDYRLGARDGPIITPPDGFEDRFDMFTMSNSTYSEVPPGVLVIPGVTDFFPTPFGMVRVVEGSQPDFGTVINAKLAVPEPGTFLAFLSGACSILYSRRRSPLYDAY